ncbi:MAG: hypothetical protein Q9167_007969 [Letrouitia subvulpina]
MFSPISPSRFYPEVVISVGGRRIRTPALQDGNRAAQATMASTSFRDSMNSMGWSRRDPDIPANTSSSTPLFSKLQSLNPFGDSGYVRLPTQEAPGAPLPAPSRREEEEGWFARESDSFHTHV